MKKIHLFLFSLISILWANNIFAQSETDSYRIAQEELFGTARYRAMAGAFTSLGGDPSSIMQNPAGIAVYHQSEISISGNLQVSLYNMAWGKRQNQEFKISPSISQFAFVGSFFDYESGNGFNFSFNRQSLQQQRRIINISKGMPSQYSIADFASSYISPNASEKDLLATDTNNIFETSPYPWLSILGFTAGWINHNNDQYDSPFYYPNGEGGDYQHFGPINSGLKWVENSNSTAYDFTFGFNFQDKCYLGTSLRYTSVNHSLKTNYKENFYENDFLTLDNQLLTVGRGLSLSLGAIFRPYSNLRLGVAYFSPTWFHLTDYYGAKSSSKYSMGIDPNTNKLYPPEAWYLEGKTPTGANSSYSLIGYHRATFGISYIFNKRGLISFDYELIPFNSSYLDAMDEDNPFQVDNDAIKKHFTLAQTFRIGAEFKALPYLSIRLGGAYRTSPMKKGLGLSTFASNKNQILVAGTIPHYIIPSSQILIAGGIGYRISRSFYLDWAISNKMTSNHLYAFPILNINNPNSKDFSSLSPVNIKENNIQTTLTFGFKF